MARDKRIRIGDVAKACGLSRSTVDRVLNRRPGVKPATVDRVQKAIEALGYSQSALDAHNQIKTGRVQVLLSEGPNPFFSELKSGFDRVAEVERARGLGVDFQSFDPYHPETVAAALDAVPSDAEAVITVGVDSPSVAAAIDRLVARGLRVVTAVSDVTSSRRHAYIGQDNFAAGRTAGTLMTQILPEGPGTLAVLIGHLEFRHLLDRQSGFQQAIGLTRPELSVIATRPYGTDPDIGRAVVEEVVRGSPDLKGIYLAGGGQPTIIKPLRDLKDPAIKLIGHEVTPCSRDGLADGFFTMIIAHNVFELARKAFDAALDVRPDPANACSISVFVRDNLL